jgi:hypothetical protein
MITLKQLQKLHLSLCNDAFDLVSKKGHDYNRKQQMSGDTLYNLRLPTLLGIDERPTQSCLNYMISKISRLSSLENPETKAKNESVRDSVRDLINYAIYFQAFYEEMQND